MADRHRAEVIVTAAQILLRQKIRRLPGGSRRWADGLEKSFLQMVGTEVRRVGVDASRDVFRAEGVVGLYHNLIDDAEMQVFNQ